MDKDKMSLKENKNPKLIKILALMFYYLIASYLSDSYVFILGDK